MTGRVEDVVRFRRRQALIPQEDWQFRFDPQRLDEFVDSPGLRTGFAGEIDRVADDDLPAFGFTQKAKQRFGIALVFVSIAIPSNGRRPVIGEQRLGGVAERVREGHADAALADVQCRDTRPGRSISRQWDGLT